MNAPLDTQLTTVSGQKIFLLRHGEVENHNTGRRFIGQTDLPLNQKGRYQAQWWRHKLSGVPLARILSSDLTRCADTAQIIAAEQSVNVERWPDLREIHLGEWEGLTFRHVRKRWPEAFRKRGSNLATFRPPGGESFLDLTQRAWPPLEKAVANTDQNLLIVAHAGVNRAILCHALGLPLENLFGLAQGYGAMNLICRREGRFQVQFLNLLPDPNPHS
jgi:probable phosphoglycerate mutase